MAKRFDGNFLAIVDYGSVGFTHVVDQRYLGLNETTLR